jgi:hypothetical protein
MTRPAFIYSPDDFAAVVQLGTTTESLFLDFKQTINYRVSDAQKETCRDIAQFANTEGGCLIIGISELKDPTTGIKVADSLFGLPDPDQMQQWIEQAIRNYLVPATFPHDVSIIQDPRGTVITVNVPPSRHLVALWDYRAQPRTIEYVRRTSHGKDWMNPDEVERHLMDGSRAAKLALITAKAHSTSERVEVVGGVWREYPGSPGRPVRWNPREPITIGQMEEYWFELRVPNERGMPCAVTIPYTLIKEAWAGASGVLMLLLTIRIIMHDDKLTLEPYV